MEREYTSVKKYITVNFPCIGISISLYITNKQQKCDKLFNKIEKNFKVSMFRVF